MRNWVLLALIFVVLFGGFSSASATHPAKIVSGVVSNVVSALIKWLWTQKFITKTAVSNRSMMKFEAGYTVETVFDGSKLGIEPYSVEVAPNGELLVLDSENSNTYKISTPLSRYSRPKLVAGSPEGYSGHVDGKPREARMNHPKGLTVDDKGNIYIADTSNMAIRKIADSGVTTIAGGAWDRGGGHVDGPSEDAKFSNDFDVVYVGASCSLLVIDRGNQAIREIQLNDDDCSYQDDSTFHLGIAVLVAAGVFGYMLALLQRRVLVMFSSKNNSRAPITKGSPVGPYQRPPKSVRPPLIPPEDEPERPEEGFFSSLGKLVLNTGSSVAEMFGGLFSGSRRKPLLHHQNYQQLNKHSSAWPMQESFVIPDEDEPPPSIETRPPTPKKTYPFMTKDLERNHNIKQSQAYYNGWDGDYRQQHQYMQHLQQQQHRQQHQQQQQHHHRHFSSGPQTYYEKSCETNEVVFGAVQEQDGRREAVKSRMEGQIFPQGRSTCNCKPSEREVRGAAACSHEDVNATASLSHPISSLKQSCTTVGVTDLVIDHVTGFSSRQRANLTVEIPWQLLPSPHASNSKWVSTLAPLRHHTTTIELLFLRRSPPWTQATVEAPMAALVSPQLPPPHESHTVSPPNHRRTLSPRHRTTTIELIFLRRPPPWTQATVEAPMAAHISLQLPLPK